MKTLISAALAIAFATNALADELPFGLWHFPGNEVYLEIHESGNAFQCRIAQDQSVIKATGKLRGTSAVEWAPVSVTDADGNAIDAQGFGWDIDQIEMNGGSLVLAGKYGRFRFEKCCVSMPKQCR